MPDIIMKGDALMLVSLIICMLILFVPGITTSAYGQNNTISRSVIDKNENYYIREESYGNVKLRVYLLEEDPELAERYLSYTKKYLALYEPLLGSFPYESFSIVESRQEEGISIPGYAVFGSKVLRLPFIVKTSLGHEIVHQWFGAYVDVDYEKGNWAEGLATYLSDYLYEEQQGKGMEYRKKILIDYRNYVMPENEITLRDFRSRSDFSSRSIGYGKSAMVFHMLRKMLGDETFFQSLRQFIKDNANRKASWDDLKKAFEDTSGKQLDEFFEQWLDRKGIPDLEISDATVTFRNGKYLLSLTISQKGDIYNLSLPVRIIFSTGEEEISITVTDKSTVYEKSFLERPLKIILDPEYDIMRRLSEDEIPPVVSAFTGKKDSFIVVPDKYSDIIEEITKTFPERKDNINRESDFRFSNVKDHSVLIVSKASSIFQRMFADTPVYDGDVLVKVYRNPLNSNFVIVLVDGSDKEQILTILKKLKHYGNYSRLVFKDGRNILKETAKTDNGMVFDLSFSIDAVDVRKQPDFGKIINSIKDKQVIYVGETHTSYSHHLVQFEIIKRLFKENKKLIIGMEMFQRPFQKFIDQYIEGRINEEAFLKKTEYFKRWSFNYNLYRDILQFARDRKIPVIALNIKKEIIDRVSKKGLDALTDAELKLIPEDIDMTNQDYRDFLKEIFMGHRNSGKRDFDNFYLSQLLWDETMAHTIVGALKNHPDYQMVVLIGNGHLQNSWGVPSRVKRLMDVTSTVILNSPEEDIKKGLADYILFPEFVPAPEPPKLGVIINETEDGVEVEKVIKGTPAYKAGIKKGDILLSLDDRKIKGLDDLKIFLLNKNRGDKVRATLRRSIFIFGTEDITVDLTL